MGSNLLRNWEFVVFGPTHVAVIFTMFACTISVCWSQINFARRYWSHMLRCTENAIVTMSILWWPLPPLIESNDYQKRIVRIILWRHSVVTWMTWHNIRTWCKIWWQERRCRAILCEIRACNWITFNEVITELTFNECRNTKLQLFDYLCGKSGSVQFP